MFAQDTVVESQPPRLTGPPSLWRENHVSFLSGFSLFVFLMGSGVLFYRQNRFVPPSFPDANMIEPPSDDDELGLSESNSVMIKVFGLASEGGTVRIAIYDSESSFNKPVEAIVAESVDIVDGEATLMLPIDQLPRQIAVAAFHDENADGELNLSRWGVPTERFGFTRNSRRKKLGPGYRETVIARPPAGSTINLSIR